jgi:ABC-type amino acid transport system permease subunit
MKDRRHYLYIYLVIAVIGIFIGGKYIEYIICGFLALLLIVVLTELITIIKWFIANTGGLADVLLFVFSVYLTFTKNSDLAFCLLYANIGFTLLYSPYIRESYGK